MDKPAGISTGLSTGVSGVAKVTLDEGLLKGAQAGQVFNPSVENRRALTQKNETDAVHIIGGANEYEAILEWFRATETTGPCLKKEK